MHTAPLTLADAVPLCTSTDPLLPASLAPERKLTLPLTPDAPLSEDASETAPLDVESAAPEFKCRDPPGAL
jgi:hypothetical protein